MGFFQRYDTFFKLVFLFVLVLVVVNLALIDKALLFAGDKNGGAALPTQILSKVGCDEECQRIIDQKVADAALRLPSSSVQDTCGTECEKKIDEKVSQAIAKLPTPKAGTTAKSNGATKTSFISVGTSFSTTNTDWTDIKGGEAWVDPADYGSSGSPTFTWEVSLKIANKNGEAWARLYDTTNNIAVSGSEVSVTTADYTTVSSGNLPLWSGRNLYRVQIKSTTSQTASFVTGRVKVVYK